MRELQPTNQQVILDVTESNQERRTESGLIIPEMAKEKPKIAPVAWMGTIENSEIKPGDKVMFKSQGGTEVEFESRKYLIVPYADILAKIVETEKI